MKRNISVCVGSLHTLLRKGTARFCFLPFLLWAGPALAADLTALIWEDSKDQPVLQIHVEGNPPFETKTLDDGRRLRLGLPGVGLGKVTEVEGRPGIKGVYPFQADNGSGTNIEFVLNDPGKLKVEPVSYGYRVTVNVNGKKAATKPATAKPAAPAPLGIEDVVYTKLPGDRVQIQLRMSGTPAKPAVFTTTNPARLAFDFMNTRVATPKINVKIGVGVVSGINTIEAKGRTRVVVNLVRSAGYTTSADNRNFTITIDNPVSDVYGSKVPKSTRFAEAQPGKHSLKRVDFRRGTVADGKIVIGLSDTGVGIDIREQAGEIIIDFQDTTVPAELQRRLDVTDFGTPVINIDTFSQGRNTRMVIAAKGKYEHLAYQAGDVFTVNIKPIVEKPGERKKDEFGYSGEKLSLNFQNIDVRAALQVIADFTGFNFVTSDTVKGSLTLRLKDVPWDQALDIIASAKNLAVRKNGNVIAVGPADEVAAREKAALEAGKAALELEPLVSELIQINYAKAEDMATLLKSIKAVDGGAAAAPFTTISKIETTSNSLLSPRGQVSVDKRTNTLLVQDIVSKIREIRRLVSQLDQPVRQVMIETRLVEASDQFAKNIGVRWAAAQFPDFTEGKNQTFLCGTIECAVESLNGGPITLNNTGLSVDLGAGGVRGETAGRMAFTLARLADGHVLSLELSALEAEGKGKVISSPRLITSNQAKARIEQGQEGIFRALAGGAGTTSFIIRKAVLALEVTPQITPDERIIMDVNITKDRFSNPDTGLIDKKEIKTQVLLNNGETVVIGGVYEQSEITANYKVPFFGDLPLLGWMFRKKTFNEDRTEMLVFLTPRILSENISLK